MSNWKKKRQLLIGAVCLAAASWTAVCHAADIRDGWDSPLSIPASRKSRAAQGSAEEPGVSIDKTARWTDIEQGLAEVILTEEDTPAYSNVACDYILVLDRTRTMALNDTMFQGGASQSVNASHSPCLNREHYYEYNGEQVNLYDYTNGEVRGSGEYRSFPSDAKLYDHHRNAQGQAIRPDAVNGCIDRMALAKETIADLISQIEAHAGQSGGMARSRISYWSFAGTYWPEAEGELDTDLEKGLFNYVPLTTDYQLVRSCVEQTLVYAGTYYQNSFQRIYEQLSSRTGVYQDAPAKVIFISDGKCADNYDQIRYWNELIRTIPGCTLYTLAIGMQASSEEAGFLRELSTNRDGSTFAAFVTNLHSEDPAFAQTLSAIEQSNIEIKAVNKKMYDVVETKYWEIVGVETQDGQAKAEGGTVTWDIPEGSGKTYTCRIKLKLKEEYRWLLSDTSYPTNRDGQSKGCRIEYEIRGGSYNTEKRTQEKETPILPYGAVRISGEKFWTISGSEAKEIHLTLLRKLEGQKAEELRQEKVTQAQGWEYSFQERIRGDGIKVPLVLYNNEGEKYEFSLTEESEMYECIRAEESQGGPGDLIRDLYNRPYRIKVRLRKTDAQSGAGLEGAVFAVLVYEREGSVYIPYTGTQDSVEGGKPVYLKDMGGGVYESEGWLYYSEENEGKFRLVEEKAPYGYAGDFAGGQEEKQTYDIQITGENHETTVTKTADERELEVANMRVRGQIALSKVDEDSRLASPQGAAVLFYEEEEKNARYGLFAGETIVSLDTGEVLYDKGMLVRDGRVDREGRLVFEDLELGDYLVRELGDAPEGYLLDSRDYPVSLAYQGEQVLEVEETLTVYEPVKKQRQVIYKITGDGDEMNWLEGAGFSVFPLKSLTNIAVTEGMADEEIVEAVKEAYLDRGSEGYSAMKNLPPLILYEDGEAQEVGELKGEGGVIETPLLPYGDYVIAETTTPKGKLPVDPIILHIRGDDEDRDVLGDGRGQKRKARLLKDSDRLSKLVIRKTEEGGSEAIPGAAYRVKDLDGAWKERYFQSATLWEKAQYALFYDGYVIDQDPATGDYIGTKEHPWVTRELKEPYGCAAIIDAVLPCGTYELEEIKAPEGYIIQGEEGQIAKNRTAAGESGNGTFYETQEEGAWTKTPSEAVVFQITEQGMIYDGKTGTYMTEVWQENTRPVGKLSVFIEGEKLSENEQGQLVKTKQPQEGAVFLLEAAEDLKGPDGEVVYRTGDRVAQLVSNEEGKAWTGGTDDERGRPEGLLLGNYYLTQMKAGNGFGEDTVDREKRLISITYVDEKTPVIYRDEVYTVSEAAEGEEDGGNRWPGDSSRKEDIPSTGDAGPGPWMAVCAISGGILLIQKKRGRK